MALTAYSDVQTKYCDSQSCAYPRQSAFIRTLLLFLSTSVFSLVLYRIRELHHCTLVRSLKDEKIRKIFVSVDGFVGSIVRCMRKVSTKASHVYYEQKKRHICDLK